MPQAFLSPKMFKKTASNSHFLLMWKSKATLKIARVNSNVIFWRANKTNCKFFSSQKNSTVANRQNSWQSSLELLNAFLGNYGLQNLYENTSATSRKSFSRREKSHRENERKIFIEKWKQNVRKLPSARQRADTRYNLAPNKKSSFEKKIVIWKEKDEKLVFLQVFGSFVIRVLFLVMWGTCLVATAKTQSKMFKKQQAIRIFWWCEKERLR